MPIAYLTTQGMQVNLVSARLEIQLPTEVAGAYSERRAIPIADLEHVVVDSGVSVTTKAITALLEAGVPLLFLTNGHLPAGVALPINKSTKSLALQLDAVRAPEVRLRQARRLIEAKVLNMRRVLQRLAANRKDPLQGTPQWLTSMAVQASAAASIDALLGLEGASTGRYFEALGTFFPNDMPFERRSRRPPHNPANACLSFLYTLLVSELTLHLRLVGLEPGWGFMHEMDDGRPALALDLIEPFRAPVVDALVLDLFNHKRLTPLDFEMREGGCLLRRDSRRKVFAALEDRLEREFQYERTGQRTTLRQILRDHAHQAKRACTEGWTLDPFRMN